MELLKTYPENISIIDASKTIEEVFSQSMYHIEEVLKNKGGMIL